ncbi:hypothetical protein STCU_09453 [Strigomonas culicis]|uniref:Ubiquitin-like domain-containing protein n=1 Tax=Strigomonas culicis TaxID=28005 RepID=S9TSA5_9TRYP|nr:hypothetical protein STCU_09453 [Strigomonas culicis]|eukprot:EPY19454.1 hypothetical protein STCU_09453 [Strigomonas culicis]
MWSCATEWHCVVGLHLSTCQRNMERDCECVAAVRLLGTHHLCKCRYRAVLYVSLVCVFICFFVFHLFFLVESISLIEMMMEDEKQAFFVESVDGRKFKMVIRGDLSKLTVTKIKRYLKSYGVPDHQQLQFHGRPLEGDMTGRDFGLANDCVLQLYEPPAAAPSPPPSRLGGQRVVSAGGGAAPTLAPLAGPRAAWGSGERDAGAELQQLRDALARAEADKQELQQQLQQLRQQAAPRGAGSAATAATAALDPLLNAQQNLRLLGQHLQAELALDRETLTCAIGADDALTVMVTYDPPTERLYVYGTVLHDEGHAVFATPGLLREAVRGVSWRALVLGREVCGGGLGLSRQNEGVWC